MILGLQFACAAAFTFTRCASIVYDSSHPMKVETKTSDGEMISGADCKASNDDGAITMKSADATQLRRSRKDLDIGCEHPQNPDADARAIVRVNGGMVGNILFSGGIGTIIDHNKGTACTCPTWVQLVFGKTLVFDRTAETEGRPTPAAEASAGNYLRKCANL